LKNEIEKKNVNRKKTTTKLFTLQQLQRVWENALKKISKSTQAKQALKNKKARFLIKQILKDEIEGKNVNRKKKQCKKKKIAIKKIRIKFNIKTNWN
jgi:hypothetical protein